MEKGNLQERYSNARWTKRLGADEIDTEARGYGPYMAASMTQAELEDTGSAREVPADKNQILEAPGDVPSLPEPIYKSFEDDFFLKFREFWA